MRRSPSQRGDGSLHGRARFPWMALTPTILLQQELCHHTEMSADLLACDDDRSAETLCPWWQLAQPIFSRVLIAQHRCRFCVRRDHQEGLIAIARRAVDTVDGPLPGGTG